MSPLSLPPVRLIGSFHAQFLFWLTAASGAPLSKKTVRSIARGACRVKPEPRTRRRLQAARAAGISTLRQGIRQAKLLLSNETLVFHTCGKGVRK